MNNVLQELMYFITTNPMTISTYLVIAGWLLTMSMFSPFFVSAYNDPKNKPARPLIMAVVGISTAVVFFSIIYAIAKAFENSLFIGLFTGVLFMIISLISGVILDNRLDRAKIKAVADTLASDSELVDGIPKNISKAIGSCVAHAFLKPHFSPIFKESLEGHTIFVRDDVIYGVINNTDYRTRPVVIKMGHISILHSPQNEVMSNLCYLCAMNINDTTRDLVLNYADRFDHFKHGELVITMRKRLLEVMKADSLLSNIILN